MGRGFLFGLAGGVAVGVLVGWLLFGGRAPTPRSSPAREVVGAAGEEEAAQPPAPLRERAAAPAEPAAPREVREADARDLIARLDAAREARDPGSFRALLAKLGATGTRAAQEKLVALMADPTLTFPGEPVAYDFFEWLRGSDVPGIAAAARARIEREAAENPDDAAAAARGWPAILALHGTEADLDWIDARWQGRTGAWPAIEAFVHAGARPEVAARLQARFRERQAGWYAGYMRIFAKENPRAALALVEEGLRDPRRGDDDRDLARVYGDFVGPEDLDGARSFLLRLDQPSQRIAAVYALERMRRRGLDVSGTENLVLAPVETLERATHWTADESAARYAIVRNRITWSERAAKALETAAAVAPEHERGGLVHAARRVRTGIASPGSEWIER